VQFESLYTAVLAMTAHCNEKIRSQTIDGKANFCKLVVFAYQC